MANNSIYSSKRIAKNTIMLYIRMIVMMAITFYTTRVLLSTLGVEDFGIYNVLMGVVIMFSFMNTAMAAATQRFISTTLGTGEYDRIKEVFSANFYIYVLIVIVAVFLFESVGLWYVREYINVPPDRVMAARVVYQLVIVHFIFMTLRIPYNAAVVAYEKMDFYAYVSVLEALLALLLIYALYISDFDKLILYVILLSISKLIILLAYFIYCKKYIPECKVVSYRYVPRKMFSSISVYSGWNFFSSFSIMTASQGVNLIINFFCGVVVNAAIGIAHQLSMGLYHLVSNLQTAFSPQITKLYAAREYDNFTVLLYRNSRFCFFLFLFILVPLYVFTDSLIPLWLGENSVFADDFCRCLLLYQAIESLSYPLHVAILANDNVSRYQQISGLIFLSILPVGYIVLKLGYAPIYIFIIRIIQNIILTAYRLTYMKRIMDFNIHEFLKTVVVNCIFVAVLSFIFPYLLYRIMSHDISSLFLMLILTSVEVLLCIFYLGLTQKERFFFLNKVKAFCGQNKM